MTVAVPEYLAPYERAARRHGGGFRSLLWASTDTQAARFDAICRLENPRGRSVLDVGCGRADLLDFCVCRNIALASYVGIEAVQALAAAASGKRHADTRIVTADFVENPEVMLVGAELAVMSGSLNTLDDEIFYASISRAFDATSQALIVNFLCAPELAADDYLFWRRAADVVAFARRMSQSVRVLDDYLHGDCTVAMGKEASH